MSINIPSGLSGKQANTLIVESDAAFFNGNGRTNRVQHLDKCNQCGVKFASRSFNYCPICAMRNAEHIDLQDHPHPTVHRRSAEITEWVREQEKNITKIKGHNAYWRQRIIIASVLVAITLVFMGVVLL